MPEDRANARNSASTALIPTLRLLRAVDLDHIADNARDRAASRAPAPSVVVLGEPGQGTSSVARLLAPHEPPKPPPDGTPLHLFKRLTPPTGSTGGPNWVMADNKHRPDLPAIRLGLTLPWSTCRLGTDVTVVDAPCAGGLDGPQASLARSMVASATVAIFVTDAGSPLSRPELDYLEGLVMPLACLVVLVTKSDLYPASWAEVVRTNTQLLEARSIRYGTVRVLGFSSLLAERSLTETDPDLRSRLGGASGWEPLLEILRAELARADVAPLSGALLSARVGLLEHRQALSRKRGLLSDTGRDVEHLIREATEAVTAVRDRASRWSLDLDRDLTDLKAATRRAASTQLESWRGSWQERLSSTRNLRREPTVQAIGGEMFAELMAIRATVLSTTEEGLQRIVAELFDGTELPAAIDLGQGMDADALPPRELSAPPTQRPQLIPTFFGFNIGHAMSSSAVGGLAGSLALTGAAMSTVLAALPVAAGLGVMALTQSSRAETAAQAHFRGELARLVQSEHSEIMQAFDISIARLKPDLVVALRQHFEHQVKAAREWEADALRRRATSQEQAVALAREVDAELEIIDQHLGSLDSAMTELRAT